MKILVLILVSTFSFTCNSFADDLVKNWSEVYKSNNAYCKKLVLLKDRGGYNENTTNPQELKWVSNCVISIVDR